MGGNGHEHLLAASYRFTPDDRCNNMIPFAYLYHVFIVMVNSCIEGLEQYIEMKDNFNLFGDISNLLQDATQS